MRIGTANQYATFQRDIEVSQRKYFDLMSQISSGKRIDKPSDDPGGMRAVIDIKSMKAALEQYTTNIQRGKNNLQLTESSLSEVSTLSSRAYTLVLQGANTSVSQEQRNAMASEIDSIQKRLLQIANTRNANGSYIFSGQQTDRPALTLGASGISYNGDNGPLLLEVSPDETIPSNLPGDPLFTDLYNKLDNIRLSLEGGNVSALSDIHVAEIQTEIRNVNVARGVIGGRLRQLDQVASTHARRIDDLTADASEIEDVDITQAITELKSAESAYQAALQVTSQGSRLSLLDFMR